MTDIVSQSIVLVVLLCFSAYFSGTETSIFSLSRLEKEELRRNRHPFRRNIINTILDNEHSVLITILSGNMLVNVFSSSLGETLGSQIFPGSSELRVIIIMTLSLLVIGEMTPKNVALRHPVYFTEKASVPLFYIYKILFPMRWLLERLSEGFMVLFRIRDKLTSEHSRAIVLSALHLGHRKGIFDDSEIKIVESYFRFRDKSAHEVMIPRNRLKGVKINTGMDELISLVKSNGSTLKSFIIVYEETIDHLRGYLKVRDLVFAISEKANMETLRLKTLIHPFYTVPESKRTVDLLEEMKKANVEIALLIDEYGGTAGLVTFDSLVESLLGYFYPSGEVKPNQISENRYRLPGSYPVDDLRELLNHEIKTESTTVSGLIHETLGEIPEEGSELSVDGMKIKILKMDKGRILEIEADSENTE